MLLYELMVGIPPFRSKNHDPAELAEKIMNHKPEELKFPPFVSAHAVDLIRQLLDLNPDNRLGNRNKNKLHGE